MSVIGSNILAGASGQAAGGYNVERSLRFNSSDSVFLSRTPSTAGNRKTWTWAGWVKRPVLNSSSSWLCNYDINGYNGFNAGFTSAFGSVPADIIRIVELGGSTPFDTQLVTTQVFRDPSAWYHVVIAYDTTQATASNRVKLYVNGLQITQFSTATYPSQNFDGYVNKAEAYYIGKAGAIASYHNDYLADVFFIDSQALDPSSFTEVSATTGQLIPKAYTGSFGTNGFWLKFSDNSAATATTLGKDYSGNSNNWTPNNLSVTAGAGNDSLVDSPTSYGTDTGAGGEVRGNYATFNNLLNTSGSYANGNLERTQSDNFGALSTICPSSGKWYAEFVYTAIGSAGVGAIVCNRLASDGANGLGQTWQLGSDNRGFLYNAGSSTSVSSYTTNDVIGLAFDCSTGAASFYKNGTLLGTITNAAFANVPVGMGVATGGIPGSNTVVANFGQRPFAYTAPSGFKALCDTNLGAPVVAKPNTVMDVALYTGNGSTQTISGLNFSPDLVWIKARSNSFYHRLYDTIRGTTKALYSNTTETEGLYQGDYENFTAFNSDGFSLGSTTLENGINKNSSTFVAWTWDAGSSTVSNTQGSITSQVRASASSGFSVVSYTANAPNNTIGHGLGVRPEFVITKARTRNDNWLVYHSALGVDKWLHLNITAAAITTSGIWGTSGNWTSTTFGVSTSGIEGNNYGSNDFIAYCFAPVAGYSSFGSYTGNGSADGPFVYTGFRPRWLLIKNASSSYDGGGTTVNSASWYLYDSARGSYNGNGNVLAANKSYAEENNLTDVDFLSNGFKIRNNRNINGDTNTMVYAAFAESPFAYARAR